jgi:hypothetical protein
MSWWESAPLAPQGQPKPLIDLRDPSKARDLEIKEEGNARDSRREGRDIGKTEFDQKGALYERYSKLPEVKNYRVAVQQLAQAIDTGDGPQSDLALTYAFAKAMDPESVVRESEQGMVTSSQPWFLSAVEAAKKQFGMDGAGNYTPETRRQIRTQIANAVAQRNRLYNQQREFFTELATRNNFDPYEIIGEHDAKPFAERIRAWGQGGQKTANDPEMVGGLPKGTNITFAGDDGSGFDRNRWLMETTGFDPNGEANLVAWLGANSGNPNITKEDVQAAYQRFSEGRSTGAVDDEFIAKLRSGKTPFQGFDSSFAENQLKIKAEKLAQERDTFGGAVDAYVRGAAQVPSFGLVDKAQALTDTVFNGGTYAENMDRQRLINAADEIANPYPRLAGELTGAVLTPYGAGARTPMELAKVGAVTSGATEFNQSSAPFSERLLPTALATATGGVLGYGTGKAVETLSPVVSRMFSRAPQASDDLPAEMSAPEFIAAAQRQNVDYLPADIPGSYGTQIATSIADKTLGSKFIQEGAQQSVDSVQNAVRRTTDNLGGAGDDVRAGQSIQRGVNAWQDAKEAQINDLYEKIPVASDAVADTTNTLSALRDVNNPLVSNPQLSAQISDPKLKAYQQALEGGGLSWQDLKSFRSYLGQKLGAPSFQSDIPKDRLKAIYAGLSADMEATAAKQGPKAITAFKRANTFKRAVETRRENVMVRLLGKNMDMTPEKTFAQMQSWAKAKGGDFAKLSQATRSIPEDEANAVRATFIDSLGTAPSGAQNASGTAFSPATFATRWNDIAPRAKAVLFQGEHRAALDDIAGLATSMKRADRYNNNSNTGVMVGGTATAATLLANPMVTLASIGGQVLSGVILGSPRLAKWVAALYKKPNAKAVEAHIARLDNLAKAEPIIADNVFQLQTRLREAFGQGQMQLAANPGDEKGTPLPTAKTNTAGEPQ